MLGTEPPVSRNVGVSPVRDLRIDRTVFGARNHRSTTAMIEQPSRNIHAGAVVRNQTVCRDHQRLTFRVDTFAEASPGQFVHVCPETDTSESEGYRVIEWNDGPPVMSWAVVAPPPMLRRAYSVADLRRTGEGVEIDILYRVVGRGTRWLRSLRPGDSLSALGPLGNAFPISGHKRHAWMVAGGVGIPPMLWLAEALRASSKSAVAFCGAQSADLVALSLDEAIPPSHDATFTTLSAAEFAAHGVPVIISTDDGTLGYRGHIGSALEAHYAARVPDPGDLVVYTCGPERMMRFVAEFCVSRGIECHVCMERAMACGTGMCQSCVVPLRGDGGWSYRLCCTDGPIFSAENVLWETPAK